MKQLFLAAAVFVSAPALAVTPNGWSINALSSVTIGEETDTSFADLSGTSTAGNSSVSTLAAVTADNEGSAVAFSGVSSTFVSATQGNVEMT
jgi:hypothetical protein